MSVRMVVALALVGLPSLALAQDATTGAIAGVARDATGAILPGVTVEASSPALIEKVRTATTDDQGNYKIVDLRPGTYSVTFTLPGFSTFRREGLELSTGITANVNADMKVGSLEETLTVTGASPVVDIQNARSQTVLGEKVLDALPFARSQASFALLTLGMSTGEARTADVGGVREASSALAVHGGRPGESRFKIDGLSVQNNSGDGGGANKIYSPNSIAMQETALETGGMLADADTGGVQINYVPKDGGNTFSYYGSFTFANTSMQSSNLTDEHRARGLTTSAEIDKIYDVGGGVGGPIVRDRLWFYTAHRKWAAKEFQPGAYFNATPDTLFYNPDLSRPAFTDNYNRDHSVRLSWQATTKNRIAGYQSIQDNCLCYFATSSQLAPEAAFSLKFATLSLTQISWSNPVSNRLLLQGGVAYGFNPKKTLRLGVPPSAIGVIDIGTGKVYGASAGTTSVAYNENPAGQQGNQMNGRVTLSYVTGSHAFKTGFVFGRGWDIVDRTVQNSLSYTFRNGVPLSLNQWAVPILTENHLRSLSVYAQDQWTVRRLTVTAGARVETFKGWAPAADLPPSRFLPARHFDSVDNVPNWKDVLPRAGVAYDVFGNGRTAIKGSIGRFVQTSGVSLTEGANPQFALVTSASRTWSDANGNLQPDCVLTTFTANGECGALSNSRFGTSVISRRYADDVIEGWGVRPSNWQSSLVVQQELRPGMALNAGYYRTWYGNITVNDNTLITPADFSEFCVTVPTNADLPESGQRLCGFYDLNPAKFGQIDYLVTQGSNFGDFSQVFDGVDVNVTGRFGTGGVIGGGVAFGRTVTDNCYVVDSPAEVVVGSAGNYTGISAPGIAGTSQQQARPGFCKITAPWWKSGGQVKVNAVYPLPWWGLRASAVVQNVAGAMVQANHTFTNAEIAPSLGRNLSAGPTATVTLPILRPNELFEKRLTQVDVRFTKVIKVGRGNIEASVDAYNLFNAGTILSVNNAYGARWRQPTLVLPPRLMKIGATVNF